MDLKARRQADSVKAALSSLTHQPSSGLPLWSMREALAGCILNFTLC